jgi:predicted MPP superfamily phosphohydrolase
VADALEHHGIHVLDHARRSMRFQDQAIDLVGLPDAHVTSAEAYALLAALSAERPTIVLAHDPVWFAHLPAGPHLMLAGHTHGGQIRLPGIGVVRTATKAPRRWSHGLIEERGQYLYVTSGIGTSGLPLRWGVPPEIAVLEMSGRA